MEELDKARFRTVVNNMFIQLFNAISKGNLDDVLHFLKEQPKEYVEELINNLKENNCTQHYDEMNINDLNMKLIYEDREKLIYGAAVTIDSLNYITDKNDKIISGYNDCRVKKTYFIKIIKNIETRENDIIRRCPGCGHSLDSNYSGKCPYCEAIFNQEDYDYQLLEIKEA